MSKTAKENDHEFLKVPDGFIKMELVLTFSPQQISVWEDHILRMLVRDFYIFYSVIDKFGKGEFFEIHFFSRPKDESSITYRIGVLAQTMFNFHRPLQDVINADHRLPDNYPKCIFLEPKKVSSGIMEGPIYKCNACETELIETIPGKHQCENMNCNENKEPTIQK